MNNWLVFALLTFNLLLTLVMLFWAVNNNCSLCRQEMPLKSIFTFKNLCPSCQGGKNE